MTTHTHTSDTPDHSRSNVEIDLALVYAAERAANAPNGTADGDCLPAVRSAAQSRHPNHPSQETAARGGHLRALCRGGMVSIIVARLPIFPQTLKLDCGHRVVLQPGPQIVIPARQPSV